MKIPSTIITLIAGIGLTLISLWYGQHHGLMPVAASEEATLVDDIFNLMMTIATGLFLIVEGALIVTLIRFRRKKGDDTDGPPIEGNVPLEIVWTAIPTVIVFVLAIYSFEIYNAMGGLDPMVSHDHGTQMAHHHQKSDDMGQMVAFSDQNQQISLGIGKSDTAESGVAPLPVTVNGIQYAWIFNYPELGITSGDLHIPINRPVELTIQASDVLHAFWLPEFRLKQDAIPGRDAELVFTSNRLGKYPIICAELCGSYHGSMKSTLYVETQEAYDQWVQQNILAQNPDLDKAVAVNPATMSNGEFLAPYAQEMGVKAETLAQLHKM